MRDDFRAGAMLAAIDVLLDSEPESDGFASEGAKLRASQLLESARDDDLSSAMMERLGLRQDREDYADQDWIPWVIKSGKNKGKQVWKNTKTKKISHTDPAQKKVKPPPKSKAKSKLTAAQVKEKIQAVKAGNEELDNVIDQIATMTVKDIQGIKKELGFKASGKKSELAKKIALLALAMPPENQPTAPKTDPTIEPIVDDDEVSPGPVPNEPATVAQPEPKPKKPVKPTIKLTPLSAKAQGVLSKQTSTAQSNRSQSLAIASKALSKVGKNLKPQEIEQKLVDAFDQAEITANIRLPMTLGDGQTSMLESLMGEPRLKNVFETGVGASSTYGRNMFESSTFGSSVTSVPGRDRPKYASVNWGAKPEGSSPSYGGAVFVFNKEALKDRMTLTADDSAVTNSDHVGTVENPAGALARNQEALKAAGILGQGESLSQSGAGYEKNQQAKSALAGGMGLADRYAEVQIWGDLPIDSTTIKEIRLPMRYDATREHYIKRTANGQKIPTQVTEIQWVINQKRFVKWATERGISVSFYE